jgi:predicted Zn-dependent peptidase
MCAGIVLAGDVVDRPEKLKFKELTFDVPSPDSLRFELSNGTPVYLMEDHQLPLVNISVFFKGGRYLVPADKAGLAELVSEGWRSGGAGDLSAQELDEKLDFLAAAVHANIGDVRGSAFLNVMSKDLNEAMGLFMNLLTQPRFQNDRFAKAKDDLLQAMKQRNDDTAGIEAREWDRLIYGDDFWMNRLATKASLGTITVDDAKELVSRLIRSDNLVLAVSGDISRDDARKLLDETIGTLPKLDAALPDIPQPTHTPQPGVYVVNKPDVNQGRVHMGHIGYRLGHPDQFPLTIGNDIFGGGGFTARMMKRIRSDEGLAYGAYSSMSFPVTMPGIFSPFFQSKSSTCAFAAEIAMDLLKQMQTEPVTDEELNTSKNSMVETFPRRFESAAQVVSIFAQDEILGRPHDYWTNYRDRVRKVTAKDIQKAFAKDIRPDDMIMLVVGNIEEIMAGHPDHEARLTDFGPIHKVPLRDPMTLEPLTE